MTAPVTPAKICIHCGQDCSKKPRTKDPQGRYSCKECHERALAGARGQAEGLGVPAVKVSRPRPEPSYEPETEDNLIASLAAGMSGGSCVSCGAGIAKGAAICMVCGTNQETGQQLSTRLMKEPKEKKAKSGRRRRSMYIEPAWVGLGLAGFFAVLLILAWGNEGLVAVYAGLMILLGVTTWITTFVAAFQDDDKGWGIAGVLQPFVPCLGLAMLYYVFCVSERGMVKALNAVSIIAYIMFIVLSMQHGMTIEELSGRS